LSRDTGDRPSQKHRATTLVTRAKQGRSVIISVAGRLDFHCHDEFRKVYESDAPGEVGEYVVDLKQTDYIDSSALGMLLLLREAVAGIDKVRIVNCQPAVRRILEIANFNQLFLVT
jgi:anti-anti-sigma factor